MLHNRSYWRTGDPAARKASNGTTDCAITGAELADVVYTRLLQ